MEQKKITFISTLGRGMTKNMHLLRVALLKKGFDFTFEYFLNNINLAKKKEKEAKVSDITDTDTETFEKNSLKIASFTEPTLSQIESDLERFSRKADLIISCDNSISAKKDFFSGGRRILIMEPHNYIFKHIIDFENDNPYNMLPMFRNFTDVICYSPFMKEFAEKSFILDNGRFYDNIAIPFVESVNDSEQAAEIRTQVEAVYPQLKGKKILSFITSGNTQKSIGTSFFNLDIKAICDAVPDDWIIVTNNKNLSESCFVLPSSYVNKVITVSSKNIIYANLIYFSDILISDSPNLCCIFASTGKPFYVVDFSDSAFSRYIMQFYPKLFITDINKITQFFDASANTDYDNFRKKFSPEVSNEKSWNRMIKLLKE